MQSLQIKLAAITNNDSRFLYRLLKERDPRANISHRKMPTYSEHQKFIKSRPYKAWYLIVLGNAKAGSIYLSKQNEIGVFLLKKYHGKNLGQQALSILIKMNPQKRYLANVSPKNPKSAKFFKRNGFRLIQHTYEYVPGDAN